MSRGNTLVHTHMSDNKRRFRFVIVILELIVQTHPGHTTDQAVGRRRPTTTSRGNGRASVSLAPITPSGGRFWTNTARRPVIG